MTSLVVKGGRVVDPGTGTDAVRDVLVRDGTVAAVAPDLSAERVLDATGLVVGPGFIDLHSHAQTIVGHRLQALDGVTTSLELEAGTMPVADAYARAAAEGRPLHYGYSASWTAARGQVLAGIAPEVDIHHALSLLGNEAWQRSSSRAELQAWVELLRGELEAGALGIGVLQGYAPRTDPAEFSAVARLAAEAGVATFTHVRELVEADPTTPIDGPTEIVRAAAETGARMHHCHVNSTSRRHVDRVLGTLAHAQRAGSAVSLEAYPYGSGSTAIGAAFLAPERLTAWGLTPDRLVLLPSGERIADAARLREVRAQDPGMPCIVEILDESDPVDRALLARALTFPDSIVASDAMPVVWPDGTSDTRRWPLPPGGSTHPRTAGTFTRALRTLVRETESWSWLEAFRRCSQLPARALEFVPAARAKGHLGVGADADIVALDPTTVSDTATYLDPTRPAVGVRHVLVAGTPVVRDGALDPDAYPGRPLRAEPR